MRVFADTYFWVALLNERDVHHRQARELYPAYLDSGLTSSMDVLSETMTYFAERGAFARRTAAAWVYRLLNSSQVELILRLDSDFYAALERYGNRADKGWSFIDCLSMVQMEQRGIRHVLTHDHHFTQAGFDILM